ncbi:hypothetical protein P3T36_003366 [Kitasatospora sp. MAP12-15]|uniref:DUF317 domain-containing protein n=1 Tax=unclassified Kitasatospora TaxID=2633591 RepID=UPI002473B8DE|nr:DUF317 domain-containing protein [Kitasatospora sp. MAP12-44]MDH6111344.1 hypothetical protein [Kitasatospora sp. MAP12-44]
MGPVHLAGETEHGEQRVITPLTDDYGWNRQMIGGADSILDSPCRRVRLAHVPSGSFYAAAWIINAAPGPMHQPVWQGAFDFGTPPELVAALTDRLAADLADGGLLALHGNRHPHQAIGQLERAGWNRSRDPNGTGRVLTLDELWDSDLLYSSPDELLSVRRRSHIGSWEDELTRGPEAWEITAGPAAGQDSAGRLWRATFTSATPTHLVRELTAALTNPMPVFRDQADLDHRPEVEPFLVTTANFTRTASDRAKAARATRLSGPVTPAVGAAHQHPPTGHQPKQTR